MLAEALKKEEGSREQWRVGVGGGQEENRKERKEAGDPVGDQY